MRNLKATFIEYRSPCILEATAFMKRTERVYFKILYSNAPFMIAITKDSFKFIYCIPSEGTTESIQKTSNINLPEFISIIVYQFSYRIKITTIIKNSIKKSYNFIAYFLNNLSNNRAYDLIEVIIDRGDGKVLSFDGMVAAEKLFEECIQIITRLYNYYITLENEDEKSSAIIKLVFELALKIEDFCQEWNWDIVCKSSGMNQMDYVAFV